MKLPLINPYQITAPMLAGGFRAITRRESEVYEWLIKGKTDAEIGAILTICESTIGQHVRNLFSKLDTVNRVTAAMDAVCVILCGCQPGEA